MNWKKKRMGELLHIRAGQAVFFCHCDELVPGNDTLLGDVISHRT